MADTEYHLRTFRPGDAPALLAITRDAIRSIGPRAYEAAQIAAWLARHGDAAVFTTKVEAGDRIVVAVDTWDMPVAFALMEPDGHLDMLYCAPAHAGRGLARRLVDHIERAACDTGIERVHTEASDLARPVFEKAGYHIVRRRNFVLDGVPIHNWAMEKTLENAPEPFR